MFTFLQRILVSGFGTGGRILRSSGRLRDRHRGRRGRPRHGAAAPSLRGNDFDSHFRGSTRSIRLDRCHLLIHEELNECSVSFVLRIIFDVVVLAPLPGIRTATAGRYIVNIFGPYLTYFVKLATATERSALSISVNHNICIVIFYHTVRCPSLMLRPGIGPSDERL